MFKFLKDKLKLAVAKISKKVEEEPVEVEEEIEEIVKEEKIEPEKKTFFKKIAEKIKKKKKIEDMEKEIEKIEKEIPKEEKNVFKKIKEKIITKKISEDKFNELFWDLELALMENNVAVEVVEKIKEDLKKEIVDRPIKRSEIENVIEKTLKDSLEEILKVPKIDLLNLIRECKIEGRPCVLLFLGYNGSGKSLSIARVAKYLKDKGFKPILAAADTFRAAGSLQTEEYGKKVGVPVIKQETGADSCAVIFDTISAAKARGYDVVLADTAGRIHSNLDLMEELKKIVRVNKPDLNILVVDALTGTDVVQQAEQFNKVVNVDALIMTKVDVYERGGGILSAAYILRKPFLFLGCGQGYSDIKKYDIKEVLKNLGFHED